MAKELTERQSEMLQILSECQGNVRRTAEAMKCDVSNVYGMLRKETVQLHLQAEARAALSTHILPAVATIGRLSQTARSEFVQLEASKAILDRVGVTEPQQDQVLAIQINLGD